MVHMGEDGTVLLSFTQAKQILDRLKLLCLGRDIPDSGAVARFERSTSGDQDMRVARKLLAAARRLDRGPERRACGRQPFFARGHVLVCKRVRRYK